VLLLAAGLATAQEGVRWVGDYRAAAEQAAREHKLILLHFESDSCPPCRKLEANVFPRRDVAEAIEADYVAVKVNVDKTPELARRYTVPRWPMDVVVTPMGQKVYSQISPQDPAEYIARLKEAAVRSGSAAKPPATSVTQPVGFQTRGSFGKQQPAPDMSAEFESPVIENGAPTVPAAREHSEPQPAAPQQNQYVAQPQTSPYSPQVAPSEKRAETTPIASDSGTVYQGIEPVAPRAVAKARPESNPSAVPQDPEATPPARDSAPALPTAVTPPASVAQSKAPIVPPIGMEGYCVVTLHAYNQKVAEAQAAGVSPDPSIQGWVKGSKKHGAIHRGRLYLFANADAQKTFLADPDRYAPALSGYDPVVFNETQKLVDGKRAIGLCYNGQVYVFASEASLQKFVASPKPFADTVYQAMLRSDQAARLR
jgi:protein disulfide-isomerase